MISRTHSITIASSGANTGVTLEFTAGLEHFEVTVFDKVTGEKLMVSLETQQMLELRDACDELRKSAIDMAASVCDSAAKLAE